MITKTQQNTLDRLWLQVTQQHDKLEQALASAVAEFEQAMKELEDFVTQVEIEQQADVEEIEFFYDNISLQFVNAKRMVRE
jgi:Asp-tRNA(Asn)/Glu-tRNA(Gln) amidotransferase C subunit